jgi:hypothetical protein
MNEVRTVHAGASVEGLVDALDALIGDGAAIAGDVVISVGGVDLIRLDLRALLAGVSTDQGAGRDDDL